MTTATRSTKVQFQVTSESSGDERRESGLGVGGVHAGLRVREQLGHLAIAGRYDLLNHVLSAGIDRRWRSRAVRSLRLTGRETILDLCTGTGDLAIELAKAVPSGHVIGLDPSTAGLVAHLRALRDTPATG